uniref:Peptidase M12B domain-containing protein n=1 Tax=Strigamia maritima TaxID=126957 RepID=T1J3M3_STRMM
MEKKGKRVACNQTTRISEKNEKHLNFTFATQKRLEKILKPDLNLHENNICTLKLFADHTFFNQATIITDHEIIRVIFEMIFLLQQAQNIFGQTDFDDNGVAEKIGFQVKAIQIVTSRHSPNYRLSEDDLDIEDYLDLFADYDFDKFCLGLAITNRRFKTDALGVTYTASPNERIAGGICQKRQRAKGEKKPKSYNAVVVTVVGHDGQLMPRFLNGLTIAHELGHAFGSDHDSIDDAECSPSRSGDYLMSPYTLLGREANNYLFSPCSRRQITQVLRKKGFCFVRRKPVCGNAVVESGEECDCGTEDQCAMIDACCAPKGGLGTDDECTVRASQGFRCSSVGKPCCSSRCQFIQSHEIKDCTGGNDCFYASSCSGFSADCPVLTPKPDGETCRNGLGRCLDAACQDVICSNRGLLACICQDFNLQCQLCCKSKDDDMCKPASLFGIWRRKNEPFQRPTGEDCDGGRSFCDFAGQCTTLIDRKHFIPPRDDEIVKKKQENYSEDKKLLDIVTIL